MNLHDFFKNFIEKMHFDSQAYHKIFIYENCMICIFSSAKTQI